jgi:hypothetical protein
MPANTSASRDVEAELAFLTRALTRRAFGSRSRAWPNGPERRPGLMRSSSPRACNARSPPGSPTAAKDVSVPRASRPVSLSSTSTSTTPAG